MQRAVSSSQLRGARRAPKDEGALREPGIPKFYFLRTGNPTIEKEPVRLPVSRERHLTRSHSASALTSGHASERALRSAGGSVLGRSPGQGRRPPSLPLTLARLAEDLAPPDVLDHDAEEPPPGIIECRSKLEAFRSAAVEAISLEALLSIEHKRQVSLEDEAKIRTPKDEAGASKRGAHKAKSLFMEDAAALAAPRDASEAGSPTSDAGGPLPGVEETRRKLAALQAEVARAAREEAAAQMIRM
eukprot:TRINITY_DN60679_c0_g1_i1.p1 TRINITY_DN60679_c0_g1~~TRINITY_DN60679_c0_g1_i1.p1  ORF type:complete len:257 (+),score=61.82 TRINITY_DN60679_c0_g1_i1:38-772(+)